MPNINELKFIRANQLKTLSIGPRRNADGNWSSNTQDVLIITIAKDGNILIRPVRLYDQGYEFFDAFYLDQEEGYVKVPFNSLVAPI